MSTLRHQTRWGRGLALLGGVLALGAFLDSLSNAIALVTPLVTIIGSFGALAAGFTLQFIIKTKRPEWIFSNGLKGRLTALGPSVWWFILGAVLLLWFPRGVEVFSSKSTLELSHAQDSTAPQAARSELPLAIQNRLTSRLFVEAMTPKSLTLVRQAIVDSLNEIDHREVSFEEPQPTASNSYTARINVNPLHRSSAEFFVALQSIALNKRADVIISPKDARQRFDSIVVAQGARNTSLSAFREKYGEDNYVGDGLLGMFLPPIHGLPKDGDLNSAGDAALIILDASDGHTEFAKTLRHEIAHAFLFTNGMEWRHPGVDATTSEFENLKPDQTPRRWFEARWEIPPMWVSRLGLPWRVRDVSRLGAHLGQTSTVRSNRSENNGRLGFDQRVN